MKFTLDENLPAELVEDLQAIGHEAETVPSENLAGFPHSSILERVRHEGRVLLTLDKGIVDVHAYPPEHYAGFILFRLSMSGRGVVLISYAVISAILPTELSGHLLIVTEQTIKVR